mmetsp:Transcript_53287/g.125066  ORF Transcript_53287/g.125066 Transcript_53287/m.125066 type:complete len:327 (-) Transcript_53287:702-1682(-)
MTVRFELLCPHQPIQRGLERRHEGELTSAGHAEIRLALRQPGRARRHLGVNRPDLLFKQQPLVAQRLERLVPARQHEPARAIVRDDRLPRDQGSDLRHPLLQLDELPGEFFDVQGHRGQRFIAAGLHELPGVLEKCQGFGGHEALGCFERRLQSPELGLGCTGLGDRATLLGVLGAHGLAVGVGVRGERLGCRHGGLSVPLLLLPLLGKRLALFGQRLRIDDGAHAPGLGARKESQGCGCRCVMTRPLLEPLDQRIEQQHRHVVIAALQDRERRFSLVHVDSHRRIQQRPQRGQERQRIILRQAETEDHIQDAADANARRLKGAVG